MSTKPLDGPEAVRVAPGRSRLSRTTTLSTRPSVRTRSPEALPRVMLRALALVTVLAFIATAAQAEGDSLENRVQWAALPDDAAIATPDAPGSRPLKRRARSRDPVTTGSLPGSGSELRSRTLGGFYNLVDAGSIIIRPSAPTRCLPGDLKQVVADVSQRFGPVSVESTHRPRAVNRRKGGARNSLHIGCRAIDFRVRTRARGVLAYLRGRSEVGGLKIYRTGIIHIDNGERRSW